MILFSHLCLGSLYTSPGGWSCYKQLCMDNRGSRTEGTHEPHPKICKILLFWAKLRCICHVMEQHVYVRTLQVGKGKAKHVINSYVVEIDVNNSPCHFVLSNKRAIELLCQVIHGKDHQWLKMPNFHRLNTVMGIQRPKKYHPWESKIVLTKPCK